MAEDVLSTQHAKYQSDVDILLILINNAHLFLILSYENENMDNLGQCTRWNNSHILKGERFLKLSAMWNPMFKVKRGENAPVFAMFIILDKYQLKKWN